MKNKEHIYSSLPELADKDRLYVVSEYARKWLLDNYTRGYAYKVYIIFYGGYGSCITRRDVGNLRYLVGNMGRIMHDLKRYLFTTWMDYRIYHAFPTDDFAYVRIGSRTDFKADKLVELATYINPRRKLAMIRKNRKEMIDTESPEVIKKRRKFKKRVDASVAKALAMYTKESCV